MRAQRYRLRFVPGVSLSPATYGSSTYGGAITYGQRASDPLVAYRYRIVPLPGGWPTQPAWVRREFDLNPPMRAQILADQGPPLNLSTVAEGWFVLTALDERQFCYEMPLSVEDAAKGIVTHQWIVGARYGSSTFGGDITYGQHDDLGAEIPTGIYRVVIVLFMTSGRRMSVPGDDNVQLVVNSVGVQHG